MRLMEARIKLADNTNYRMIQKIGEIFSVLRDVNYEGKYGADIPHSFHVRNWSIEEEGVVCVYFNYFSDQKSDFFGLPIELFSLPDEVDLDDALPGTVCELREGCEKWLKAYSVDLKAQKVKDLKRDAELLGYVLVLPA